MNISTLDAIAIDVTPLDKHSLFLENRNTGSLPMAVDENSNKKPAAIFLPNDDNIWSLSVEISQVYKLLTIQWMHKPMYPCRFFL